MDRWAGRQRARGDSTLDERGRREEYLHIDIDIDIGEIIIIKLEN